MIFIEAQQGTPEWHQARTGKITASRFADAVSRVGGLDERQAKYVALMRGGAAPGQALLAAGYKAAPTSDTVRRALAGEDTSAPSDTAKRYAADLAIERISDEPHGEPARAWALDRGHEMETRARMLYEARTGAFITEAGICLTEDRIFGYSTDGLAGDDGLIEIKAPIDSIKIMDMWRTGDTSEYDHQMQGGMWITARKWCDFIMYVPELARAGKDLFVKRIPRNDEFIDAMVRQLAEFDRMANSYTIILGTAPAPTTTEEAMTTETTVPPAVEPAALPAPTPAEELAHAKTLTESAELSPAAQVLLEQEGAANFARAHTPPTLRLGQINERLGLGLTADMLLKLGFAPAATDRAAKLYHDADFGNICAAIQRHAETVAKLWAAA